MSLVFSFGGIISDEVPPLSVSQTLIDRVLPAFCLGHCTGVLSGPVGRHVALDLDGARGVVSGIVGGGDGSLSNGLDNIVHDTFAGNVDVRIRPFGEIGALWDLGSAVVGEEGVDGGEVVEGLDVLHGVFFQGEERSVERSSRDKCGLSAGYIKAQALGSRSITIDSAQGENGLKAIGGHVKRDVFRVHRSRDKDKMRCERMSGRCSREMPDDR